MIRKALPLVPYDQIVISRVTIKHRNFYLVQILNTGLFEMIVGV